MSRNRGVQRATSQHHGSPEWYTPPALLTCVREVLGADYHDPCPARYGAPLAANGLAVPWGERVFCNPPYGSSIMPWIRKAISEPTRELILLVPASTDSRWFAPLFDFDALCFVRGRILFGRSHGAQDHAPHASVFAYRGAHLARFCQAFADVGPVVRQHQAMRTAPSLWEVTA